MGKRLARITTAWSLLFVVLLPLQSQAQGITAIQCADPSQSMLWQVESAELAAKGISIHLFGSIHVGKREFYPLHPTLETLFRNADQLVFEVDPQAASNPQVAIQLQLRGMLSSGTTLRDVISAESLMNLEQVLGDMGIPLANFMNFKPWMIALLLTNLQVSALGYDPQYGLESYLLSQVPPNSTILELESMQQQLDMLESLDPQMFLDYSLDDFANSAQTMEDMVAAWRCADKASLQDIVFAAEEQSKHASEQEKQQLEQLHNKMFMERNLVMAKGVEAFAQTGQGSYFVVVGSGHLLGEGSVVALLQQSGYSVTPVSLAP